MEPLTGEVTRHLEQTVHELLREEPVLVLTGARTVGKSTLLRACATSAGVVVHDLDDLDTRSAVSGDPAYFVRDERSPVCFDEFQHEPALLDAIKAELNRGLRPGRYLLTGSTRYSSLPVASQSLTGRVHIVTMWPLSQGELLGRRERFLQQLMTDPSTLVTTETSATSRHDYEALVLAGGFPIPLKRTSSSARSRWYTDFVTSVIERDVLDIRKVRQRQVLPQILVRLARQTAQVLNAAAIAAAMEMDKGTVGDFIELLEAVFLTHRIPAFGRTLSSRVSASPKVHLVDSGLGGHLLGVSGARLQAKHPTTLTEFGHLLETFAVNEVLKQAGWSAPEVRFSHFRTRDGVEVDLVAEAQDGRVSGIEVKASGRVTEQDFRGLRLLRDRLGEDFVGGVLLNLGTRSYTKEDRLHVLPLDALWR